MKMQRIRVSWVVVSAVLGVGCTGEVHGPASVGPSANSGGQGGTGSLPGGGGASVAGTGNTSELPAFVAPAGMLRRLTRAQFKNAISDLLGVEVDATQLDQDSYTGNFAVIGASTVVTSQTGVEQYQATVESAVGSVMTDAAKRMQLVGCAPSNGDDSCVRSYVSSLGRRAWRRPLESAEIDRLASISSSATTALGSTTEGLRWATVALLTSPHFLYRPELGAPAQDGSLKLTAYETASRLAFLIWNSLPDAALLDAAASGELTTAEGVRASVERLLDAPAGRNAIGNFAEEYLRLDRVLSQAKDSQAFPAYGPALQAGMVRDMRGTWEALAFDERASALELFSTSKVVVNADLAKLYGLDPAGLTSTTFETRSLPADSPRLGILGKAGFLSQFANQKEGSPTLRGKFIRDALMCKSIPPPPGNVNAMLEEPPADKPMTKRQRLEMHRANPTCAGCHGLMDPLGLPLESFDAIGAFRTTEHGLSIDTSGDLDGVAVADARSMGIAMSTSETITECLVRRYYTYAVGHEERDVDARVVNALSASFHGSGLKLRDLVVQATSLDAFAAVAPQP